jgi:hypothetical protein
LRRDRHRYFHKLYALDITLDLKGATKSQIERAMKGHGWLTAELTNLGRVDRALARYRSGCSLWLAVPCMSYFETGLTWASMVGTTKIGDHALNSRAPLPNSSQHDPPTRACRVLSGYQRAKAVKRGNAGETPGSIASISA